MVPVFVDTDVLPYRRDAWISKHLVIAVEEFVRDRSGN